ncbi:hypothetical protein VIGAN_11113100, partial [Vigna angularis var. angularis]
GYSWYRIVIDWYHIIIHWYQRVIRWYHGMIHSWYRKVVHWLWEVFVSEVVKLFKNRKWNLIFQYHQVMLNLQSHRWF